MDIINEQKIVCERFGAPFNESSDNFIAGVSRTINDGTLPINGLRHPIKNDRTGWFIWAGEFSVADDFFEPMHVEHLKIVCPVVLKYLGLAPGWRFLLADGYEDVWFDSSLLNID